MSSGQVMKLEEEPLDENIDYEILPKSNTFLEL